MKRAHQILSFSAAVGAGLLAASAFAQQPASPTPTPAPTQTAPQTDAAPQRGSRGPSAEDRVAYFEAHIAAVRAGLRLTPDQERLWPPVESAVRDMARQMSELREQRQAQAAPVDPVERMARMGEMATKRGQAMSRLAEAARPLYASLTDDQKRRLRTLMRAPGRDGERGMGMGMGRDDRGHYGRHHGMMSGRGDRHHGDWRGMRGDRDHGDRRGMRGEGRGMRDGDYGRWNDWR
jgi:zinc resistance-associated protein